MTVGLTPRARELLVYLTERETCPSYEEMRKALDLGNKSEVYRLVLQLEERGHIRRRYHKPRSIQVLRQGVAHLRIYGRINLNEYPRDHITAAAPSAVCLPSVASAVPPIADETGGSSHQG